MGLPPTRTKGSGDTTPVTTFEIDAPNIPITHNGVVATIGTIPIAGGGTGATTKAAAFDALSPMTSVGDLVIGSTAGTGTRLPIGLAGSTLMTTNTGVPAWVERIPPVNHGFTSGSGTYNLPWAFIVSNASATVGATYTNNGNTFTVYDTVSSATLVYMTSSGLPASAGGTLTKTTGTGDSTIAFTVAVAPMYLNVKMVGGGGGGGGGGGSTTAGGNGGSTTFGSLLTAGGGGGATAGSNGGTGGSNTINTGAFTIANAGGTTGGFGSANSATNISVPGGYGANAPFYAGGGQNGTGGGGGAGKANSGGGGGGSGTNNISGQAGGGGGGSGGFIEAIINNPTTTYAYAVGAAGTAGLTGGFSTGGAGAAGRIVVTAHFQ